MAEQNRLPVSPWQSSYADVALGRVKHLPSRLVGHLKFMIAGELVEVDVLSISDSPIDTTNMSRLFRAGMNNAVPPVGTHLEFRINTRRNLPASTANAIIRLVHRWITHSGPIETRTVASHFSGVIESDWPSPHPVSAAIVSPMFAQSGHVSLAVSDPPDATPSISKPTPTDLLHASEALERVVRNACAIEDPDAQFNFLVRELRPYIETYQVHALYELQNAILGNLNGVDMSLRAMLLEALSRVELNEPDQRAYVGWIVDQSLGAPSHFLRSAAITSLLARNGNPRKLRKAAETEPIPRVRARMERVAGKLEARQSGLAAAQD